jgi:hypothetical protein
MRIRYRTRSICLPPPNSGCCHRSRKSCKSKSAFVLRSLLLTALLCRNGYAQSIIDNNLFDGVRRWLEPLPDKSLPALNIQHAFFDIMSKMYIDTNTLKDSGLGRVVLFYTKCKRVTSAIQRQAVSLVSVWSRPIIKRSASYVRSIIVSFVSLLTEGNPLYSVTATSPSRQN